MSRLEEIKASIELIKTLKSRGLHHGGEKEIADIEYLLHRVSVLENVLGVTEKSLAKYEEVLKKVYDLDGYMFVKEALQDEEK